MANLIRLKQIESGSSLSTAANVGANLETTINNIVGASLSGALSIIATDVEVSAVSASIVATNLTISSSTNSRLNNLEITSASINEKFTTLQTFTSSLDNGFATDLELQQTSSMIIDQGEW